MHALGHQLLADAGFAEDQHRRRRRRHAGHQLEHARRLGVGDDDAVRRVDGGGGVPARRLGDHDLDLADGDDVARADAALARDALAVDARAVAPAEIDEDDGVAARAHARVLAGRARVVEPHGGVGGAAEHEVVAVVQVDHLRALALTHDEEGPPRPLPARSVALRPVDGGRVAQSLAFYDRRAVVQLYDPCAVGSRAAARFAWHRRCCGVGS